MANLNIPNIAFNQLEVLCIENDLVETVVICLVTETKDNVVNVSGGRQANNDKEP